MQKITHLGAFTSQTRDIINHNFQRLGFGTVGRVLYLDPVNGYDAKADYDDPDHAFSSIEDAYAALRSGKNDVVRLISDGASTSTARLDVALDWAKSAAHFIGDCAPTLFSQRARIAPTSTTVAGTTNKNYLTVSGAGNYFGNFQLWAGFATGAVNTIALTVTGARNVFERVHVAGLADAASAADTGSRCLKITTGENRFRECVIGVDTVLRSALNVNIEFTSGAARNVFEYCRVLVYSSDATAIAIKAVTGALDRWTEFEHCTFEAGILSGGATIAAVATIGAAGGGPNGGLFMRDCARLGVTDWGSDAGSLAKIYVLGPSGLVGTAGFDGDDIGRAIVAKAS